MNHLCQVHRAGQEVVSQLVIRHDLYSKQQIFLRLLLPHLGEWFAYLWAEPSLLVSLACVLHYEHMHCHEGFTYLVLGHIPPHNPQAFEVTV